MTVVVGSTGVDDVEDGLSEVVEEGLLVDVGEAASSPQAARTRRRPTAGRMRIVADDNPAVQYTRWSPRK